MPAAAARKLKLGRGAVAGDARRHGRGPGRLRRGPRRADPRPPRPAHDWILLYAADRAALDRRLTVAAAALDIARHALDRLSEGLLEAADRPHPRPGLGRACETTT